MGGEDTSEFVIGERPEDAPLKYKSVSERLGRNIGKLTKSGIKGLSNAGDNARKKAGNLSSKISERYKSSGFAEGLKDAVDGMKDYYSYKNMKENPLRIVPPFLIAAAALQPAVRTNYNSEGFGNSSRNYEPITETGYTHYFTNNQSEFDSWAPDREISEQISEIINQRNNTNNAQIVQRSQQEVNTPSRANQNNEDTQISNIAYSEYDLNADGNSHTLLGYANRYHPNENEWDVVAGIMLDNPGITNPNIVGGVINVRENYSAVHLRDRENFAANVVSSDPSNQRSEFKGSLYDIMRANGYNPMNPDEVARFSAIYFGVGPQFTESTQTSFETATNIVMPKEEISNQAYNLEQHNIQTESSFDLHAGSPNEIPRIGQYEQVNVPSFEIDVRAGSPNEIPRASVESADLERIILNNYTSAPRVDEKIITQTEIVREPIERISSDELIIPGGSGEYISLNINDFLEEAQGYEVRVPRLSLMDYINRSLDSINLFLDNLSENIDRLNTEYAISSNVSEIDSGSESIPYVAHANVPHWIPLDIPESEFYADTTQETMGQGVISFDFRSGSPNEVPRIGQYEQVNVPSFEIDVRAGSPNEIPRINYAIRNGQGISDLFQSNLGFSEVDATEQNFLDAINIQDSNYINLFNQINRPAEIQIENIQSSQTPYISGIDSTMMISTPDAPASCVDIQIQPQTQAPVIAEVLPYEFTRLERPLIRSYMNERITERLDQIVEESLLDELYELRAQQWALDHPEEVQIYSDSLASQGVSLDIVNQRVGDITEILYQPQRVEPIELEVNVDRIRSVIVSDPQTLDNMLQIPEIFLGNLNPAEPDLSYISESIEQGLESLISQNPDSTANIIPYTSEINGSMEIITNPTNTDVYSTANASTAVINAYADTTDYLSNFGISTSQNQFLDNLELSQNQNLTSGQDTTRINEAGSHRIMFYEIPRENIETADASDIHGAMNFSDVTRSDLEDAINLTFGQNPMIHVDTMFEDYYLNSYVLQIGDSNGMKLYEFTGTTSDSLIYLDRATIAPGEYYAVLLSNNINNGGLNIQMGELSLVAEKHFTVPSYR